MGSSHTAKNPADGCDADKCYENRPRYRHSSPSHALAPTCVIQGLILEVIGVMFNFGSTGTQRPGLDFVGNVIQRMPRIAIFFYLAVRRAANFAGHKAQ
jgi:hypothetical protein